MKTKTLFFAAMAGVALMLAGCAGQVTQVEPKGGVIMKNAAVVPKSFRGYLTGYTYWDNTPPGSAAIARPVIRNRAGGTGTWKDPITIAVGHKIEAGRQTLDFPEGTRFYLPRLRKYAIVEDVCGDGAKPQNGPCHTGFKGYPWLDIWIGGRGLSQGAADDCARRITAVQEFVINPRIDLPVAPGELAQNCRIYG